MLIERSAPSSPPYVKIGTVPEGDCPYFYEETLFIVGKPAADRVFCFHGILGNLGNLDTSCHVLSRQYMGSL